MTERDRYTRYPRPVLWLVPEGEGVEPFYLSTLPVTNRQLEAAALGFVRSPVAAGDEDPAVGVTYEVAAGYCAWYAAVARKAIRLPTAREWEHACRAGQAECEVAAEAVWHRGNSGEAVPVLAAKGSNGFGLFAMLGGVWEWVVGAAGPELRGGSWRTRLEGIGCGASEGGAVEEAGFRIARSLRGGG